MEIRNKEEYDEFIKCKVCGEKIQFRLMKVVFNKDLIDFKVTCGTHDGKRKLAIPSFLNLYEKGVVPESDFKVFSKLFKEVFSCKACGKLLQFNMIKVTLPKNLVTFEAVCGSASHENVPEKGILTITTLLGLNDVGLLPNPTFKEFLRKYRESGVKDASLTPLIEAKAGPILKGLEIEEREARVAAERKEKEAKMEIERKEKEAKMEIERKERERWQREAELQKIELEKVLEEVLYEETLQEEFQYNRHEMFYLTNKRGIIIGKKIETPEGSSIPGGVPGAGLLKKAKSFMGDKAVPLLFVDAFPLSRINSIYLKENLPQKQTLSNKVKEKTKEKAGLTEKKPKYTHTFKIELGKLKEFNVEKEFLPEVWRTFKYMAKLMP